MWNGTAATLNASPTIVSIAPASTTSRGPAPVTSAESIPSRKTEPVAPYSSETPISMTAVEITETRKNLTAASAARRSPRRRPVIANAGRETTSRATTRVTRSRAAAIVSAPVAEQSSRKFHSPAGVRPSLTAAVPISATTAVPNSTTAQNTSVNRSATNEHCTGPASGRTTQNVDRVWCQPAAVGTAATATASTVSVAGTSAIARLRGGPANVSTRSTTTAATASTSGGATAAQSTSWVIRAAPGRPGPPPPPGPAAGRVRARGPR